MFKVQGILLLVSYCVGFGLALDICEYEMNGVRLSHPADCNKFVECQNGKTEKILSCPQGLHFNRFKSVCDLRQRAACDIKFVDFISEAENCSACCALYGCFINPECPEIPGTTQTPPTTEVSSTTEIPTSTETSDYPTTPDATETPATNETPGSSETPGTSVTPGTTETPATNETTVFPESTATTEPSETSETSETTAIPETPGTSETTASPENPSTTEPSETSETSETTAIVETPGTSETTASPENPSTTEPSETSDTSETPATSESTASPENPSTTEATETSETSETTASPETNTTITSTTLETPITPGSRCSNNLTTCAGEPDGSVAYVNGTCNQYIVCVDNCSMIMSCPNNLQYNMKTQRCDYPQNVQCPWQTTAPVTGPSGITCAESGKCANQHDGKLFPDLNSNGYIVCQCECEVKRPCPAGTKFNEQLLTCALEKVDENDSEIEFKNSNEMIRACENDIKICKNQTEGTLLPVDGICNKFYTCNFGCAVEMLCPNNLIYNPKKGYCDYPQNYKCPWPYTPPLAGPSGITCPSGGRCTGQVEGTLLPSLSSCSKYVVCQCECEVEMDCSKGLLWDNTLLTCNHSANVICNLS